MKIAQFKQSLQPVLQLFSNAAWLLSTEFISKLTRIITIVVLAGALTPVSYGTAMLALAFHDTLALLLRAGVGAQIIRCEPGKLAQYAKNGATIQWGICLSIALIQYFLSEVIGDFYQNEDVAQLLQIMACIYLFYPWVSIKVFLLQRSNNMRWFSTRNAICVIAENLSIAAFAVLGADIFAVAFAKIVFSLLWLIIFSFSPVKSYGVGFEFSILAELLSASGKLFNSEFLRAFRMNADTFIAGKLMSPELFGLYSFAKNAGIGLSQSVGNVFNQALYPFICKLNRSNTLAQYQKLIYLFATGVGLIFVVQAILVPIYLPIIFDEKWYAAIPIATLICLVALPTVIVDTYCSFQRATGDFSNETFARLICLVISLSLLAIVRPTLPMEFAIVLLTSSLCWCMALYLQQMIKQKYTHKTQPIYFINH